MKTASLSTKLVLVALTTIALMLALSFGKGVVQSYAAQLTAAAGGESATSISTMSLSSPYKEQRSTSWEKRDLSKGVGSRF